MKSSSSTNVNDYTRLLSDIKSRIHTAQLRAVLSVNAELIQLYWDIGRLLHQQQQEQGWGAGVIAKLAQDLHNAIPEEKGFSERNLKRMLAFYRAYPTVPEFMPQALAQIDSSQTNSKVPQPVAQIPATLLQAMPWGHQITLIEKIKDIVVRRWYMEQILEHGWSRNILVMQIETAAHQRHGAAISNFQHRLPSPQSDFAQQTLKDPYLFDFTVCTGKPFK